jgi:hypothetical protein
VLTQGWQAGKTATFYFLYTTERKYAMQKPTNYDTTKPAQTIGRPRKGYYVFTILHAAEELTKPKENQPSRPMLVLHLDIAEGPYAGYFMDKWRKDKKYNPDKAFYRAIYRCVAENVERLKGDMLNVEKSNPGYTWGFDEATLIGKVIGGGIGEYEYLSKQNSVQTDIELRNLVSVSQVHSGELDPPALRKLKGNQSFANQGWSGDDGDVPEYAGDPGVSEEDLPF